MVESKVCTQCGEDKAIDLFATNNAKVSGKESHCKTCARERSYKYRYGITISERDAMLEQQGYSCLICSVELGVSTHAKRVTTGERACIDHCHDTGEVRGILCARCNTGIGMFNDNPGLIENALKYLEKN